MAFKSLSLLKIKLALYLPLKLRPALYSMDS